MCDCGTSSTGKYFGKIGGQLGDRFDAWGNNAISSVQKRIKSWTGLGDYNINYNSLIGGNEPTQFQTSGRGLIIKHKEYLGDVVTGPTTVGQFSVTKFPINPGNVITYPWLNPIALQYDQYRPRGIIFEFVSTASDTSTSASLGSVLFATQYDVTDPDPVSKAEMMNRAYANEVKMSENGAHGLECDPAELQRTLLYCRVYNSTVNDPRDFDMANFYIATQGGTLPVSTIVGSLYVHYEYEFFKQNPQGGLPSKTNIQANYFGSIATAGTGINFTNIPLSLVSGRNIGISFDPFSFIFPRFWAGTTFLVTCVYQNRTTATASTNTVIASLINCTTQTNTTGLTTNAGYWTYVPHAATTTWSTSFQVLINISPNINNSAVIAWSGVIGNFPTTTAATGTTQIMVSFEVVSRDYGFLQ